MPSPDRTFLENVLLPELANLLREHDRVLFVGLDYYTTSYGAFFNKQEFHTIDVVCWRRVYSRNGIHKTQDLKTLTNAYPPNYFQLIIVNGIFGFGIDDSAGIAKSLKEASQCLRPGGYILVGWNPGRKSLPLSFDFIVPNLVRCAPLKKYGGVIDFITHQGDPHQYLFFTKSTNEEPQGKSYHLH